mmetsp:Transcript_30214/g.54845  ORF Transcript_30214/g.54845 Transcript_30214/m.54845 type:complete len:138 (-) Transcript_30214:28-441(-)
MRSKLIPVILLVLSVYGGSWLPFVAAPLRKVEVLKTLSAGSAAILAPSAAFATQLTDEAQYLTPQLLESEKKYSTNVVRIWITPETEINPLQKWLANPDNVPIFATTVTFASVFLFYGLLLARQKIDKWGAEERYWD